MLHTHYNCVWRLRLAPPSRNTRTDVRSDGCLCSHGFVFVLAASEVVTVLFHRPGHLQVLSFLWDFHLHLVPELWLVRCRNSSRRLVCGCNLSVLRAPSRCVLVLSLLLTTRLTDSVDHPSARNSLAVTTLVIATAGPLRTNAPMLLDLVKKLLCPPDSRSWTTHEVACMHLEGPGTW